MMNDNTPKKVALFVCHDLVGLLMLNKIVPVIEKAGLKPVIFNTGRHKNRKFRHRSPAIVAALNVGVLEDVIIPFLEKGKPDSGMPNLTYRQLAERHSLDYAEIEDVNDLVFVKQIAADKGFIGAISLRFLQVFNAPIIEAFRNKGFMWNLHSGLLPGYKGLLTPYRAIENGETEYGLTLHETVAGIDGGGIVTMGTLSLDPYRPVLDLYLDTVDIAAEMLKASFVKVVAGGIPKGVQQSGSGAYYSNPTTDEFKRFMERGIFYADPVSTVHRVTAAFAAEGSLMNELLTMALQSFLEGTGITDRQTKSGPDGVQAG